MAEPMRRIVGSAYPLGLQNVDTDLIIPAEYMKTVSRNGLARGAFEILRKQPGNVFEDARWKGAPILIAGANFGCGSSREHAVWALVDLGVQAIIASSFSDIFEGNAFRNGILTISLSQEHVNQLIESAQAGELTIDLKAQTIVAAGVEAMRFDIDPFRKRSLLSGLDEIALTLESITIIEGFERFSARSRPWVRITTA